MQTAIELRQQMPQRSVEQIIFLLEEKGTVPPNSIAASTLARHFRKAGVNRQELLKDKATGAKGHRRFEVADTNILWQSDFQHTLYLPDPKDAKRKKKALLFAILDDYLWKAFHR